MFGTPQLPTGAARVYLDVEGNPNEGFDYLVGMIVVEGNKEERHSFWADTREQEDQIFQQFLAIVCRFQDCLVYCYGSYERAFLKRMRKRAKNKKLVDRLLKSLVNILSVIYAHVYVPVYSNGLKTVGACLGCSWSEADASGLQSLVWRMRWEMTRDEIWRQKLTTYNLEDCAALRRVTEFVYAAAIDPETGLRSRVEANPLVASVRTSKTLKKNRRRLAQCRNDKVRLSQRVEITSNQCPSCQGANIIRWAKGKKVTGQAPSRKRAFDLLFTSAGIRRKVIECRTRVHECLSCQEIFLPEQYQRLAKHFHGLMSWAMFEHIAHRISYGILAEMLKECFGLTVSRSELHLCKSLMSWYYRTGFRRLLRRILSSPVLHIDETEVNLRTGKGYVWVFTTLEEVIFLYRPTREGDFLKKLLKDFHGVMVSDFYTTYDAIDCPQQKCLIHLMRDMNQDLLNNSFDHELQSITGPFGVLLRQIITTIDQHGLKRGQLKKHHRGVAQFFQSLAAQLFHSEVAEALRQRLLKYRDKLFTFTKYDGVPWNNNNAENAIKRFAYYREDTAGVMKEAGLKDYLILLSICHTCRYRGISFLKFLQSRERDVGTFYDRPRHARMQHPMIESLVRTIDSTSHSIKPGARRCQTKASLPLAYNLSDNAAHSAQ